MSTDHSITIDAADHRRALAALTHYLYDDLDGLTVVLNEATGRQVELLLAVLNSTTQLLPELRTPLGVQLLRQQLMYAATEEGTTDDR